MLFWTENFQFMWCVSIYSKADTYNLIIYQEWVGLVEEAFPKLLLPNKKLVCNFLRNHTFFACSTTHFLDVPTLILNKTRPPFTPG